MVRPPKKSTDEIVDENIDRGDGDFVEKKSTKREPTYQMVGNSKIPVGKGHGKLWKSRHDQCIQKRKRDLSVDSWDEAIRYYRNDQTAHRVSGDGSGDSAGNEDNATKLRRNFSETENMVFANTSALVPSLYAKNPTIEATNYGDTDDELTPVVEKLVNRLLTKKHAPGVNMKPKARKAVVMTTLTNASYIEVGYTFRDQSSETAFEDMQKISTQLSKAKTPKDVERLEGELMAIENKIELLRPSGPWCKFRRPHDVLVDSDSMDEDHEDAKYMMVGDYVSTDWLNAQYGKKDGKGRYKSIYMPTHVMKSSQSSASGQNHAEMEINQYSLLSDDEKNDNAQQYGYNDEESYHKARRTRVWYVWDKVTQRVLLFNDKDWTWPIWVWDNPYNLQGFFPLYKLQFYTDPEEPMGKAEVTYYLDQQDAINTINSEMKQARQWARRNVFFDKSRVSKDEVESMLKGDEDMAIGVDIPEGQTLKDFIMPMLPPSMHFVELFDKGPIYEAIDRVSSVQPVMRGIEFKTNTTNDAIDSYNSTQQTRLDEKIDAVEDWIGKVGWALAQMTLQFMDKENVADMIGDTSAANWENLDPRAIQKRVQMRVVGGSTSKPTAESKKQQSLQMGQVLGQYVQAAPMPVMMAMLESLRTAFNDTIPDEKWSEIIGSLEQQAQQPDTAPGESGPTSEQGDDGAGDPATDGDPAQVMAQLEQVLAQLPPEALEALGKALAQGVPLTAALERIIQVTQQPQGTA